MLIIEIKNVTELSVISSYTYEVWVTTKIGNKKVIAKGTVIDHERTDGWRVLVQRIINESKDIG